MASRTRLRQEPEPDDDLFASFANASWTDASELRGWLVAHDLIADVPVRRLPQELTAFDRLRGLVRAVADRLEDGRRASESQVAELNRFMRGGPHVHALRPGEAGPALVTLSAGEPFSQARAVVAASLARYLAEEDPRRLRRCASETCRWVFVDRSRAGRRRWCDMSVCGNRAKVRRHRARQRRGAAAQRSSAPHPHAAGIE